MRISELGEEGRMSNQLKGDGLSIPFLEMFTLKDGFPDLQLQGMMLWPGDVPC